MDEKHQATVSETSSHDLESPPPEQKKLSKKGIILVPQPSDDPNDPLNWPKWRKFGTFAALCLAAFAGLASAIAHANGLVVQGKVYHITPTKMSYSISAATAGLMAGPFLLCPLARVFGTGPLLFWCLIGQIVCGIWSQAMTGSDQYIPFVISRLFGGMFSSPPQILGNGVIVNMFFLHERGRAFAVYTTSYIMGVSLGPAFDGFIVQHTHWPWEFRWTVILQAVVLIWVFIVFEESTYDRNNPPTKAPSQNGSWLVRRLGNFFAGTAVEKGKGVSLREFLQLYWVPVKIFFSPVTILIGLFDMLNFGWAVVTSTVSGIYLQEPVKVHGYGYTPQHAAGFGFTVVFAVSVAQVYTYFVNDRVPLWLARRNGGIWKPEYRLWTALPLGFIAAPVGLGLFGAALEDHLHIMVLAVGTFFIYLAANGAVPIPSNYLVETFRRDPVEIGTALGVWRMICGLAIPFFLEQWEDEVGINWTYGMAAFINIFATLLLVVLLWKGPTIRKYSFEKVMTEEGTRLTK